LGCGGLREEFPMVGTGVEGWGLPSGALPGETAMVGIS
jgi:hypothetical protein